MKKRIICFILTVVMAVLLVFPAYATTASEDWILMGDAEYIIHGDNKYYPVEFPYYCFVDYNLNFATVDLEIKDQRFAHTYAASFAYITQGYEDMVIEVVLFNEGIIGDTVHYVEESYLDEFYDLRSGEASSYVIENDNLDFVPVTEADLERWSNDESRTIVGDDVDSFYHYFIYARDESGVFMHEVGIVLEDMFEDDLYLLKYDECDPMCFEDGIFIGHTLANYRIYEIDDDLEEVVGSDTFDYYDDSDTFDPFYSSDGKASGFSIVFISFIFGVVPFAAVTFGIVKAIRCKDKKYRTPFILLAAGAALTLASFIVLLALALM